MVNQPIVLRYGNDRNNQQGQMQGLLNSLLMSMALKNLQTENKMLRAGINPDDPVGSKSLMKKWDYNLNPFKTAGYKAFGLNTPTTLWQDANNYNLEKNGLLFGVNTNLF